MNQDKLNAIHKQLERCEAIIAEGLSAFYESGKALARIRDERLYRNIHKTFEAYCQERWDIKRQRAYELIAAAQVVDNVGNLRQTPGIESHCKPLVNLHPADQQKAWTLALELAGEERVTASYVKMAVRQIKQEAMSLEERVVDAMPRVATELMVDLLGAGRAFKCIKEKVEADTGQTIPMAGFEVVINQIFGSTSMDVAIVIQAAVLSEQGIEDAKCVPTAYALAEVAGDKVLYDCPVWKYFRRQSKMRI